MLIANRNHYYPYILRSQLHFASSDLALYSTFSLSDSDAKQKTIFDLDREIAERILVVPRLPEDRFLCSFWHIFGGGYSAGYYR